MNKKKLKIILFALTGFGNTVLKRLISNKNVFVSSVITEKYDNPFPYYKETQLLEFCHTKKIPCYYDITISSEDFYRFLSKNDPDLIIVATFKKIIPLKIIDLPNKGIVNIHPSLLPKYKGPCPTNHVLLNNEKKTGITIHYLTEKLDSGNIILQNHLKIVDSDNDGKLRQKLALLAGSMIPNLINLFLKEKLPLSRQQDNQNVSYAPKIKYEDAFLENSDNIEMVKNKINAYNPLPGTTLLINEKRIIVDKYKKIYCKKNDGIYEYKSYIDFFINREGIRLIKQNPNIY